MNQSALTGHAGQQNPLEKAASLQREYHIRKSQMGDAIQKVIDNSKVAHIGVYSKSKEEVAQAMRDTGTLRRSSLIKDTTCTLSKTPDPLEGEKLADGFVRSNRNVALRIKDELNNQFTEAEQSKVDLMQKLNHALVKLDKLNSANREQSNLLVEKIRFVRDLQKATGDGDDVGAIISKQMKEEFRKEQQINHRLQEEIKRAEMDRQRILEQIKLLSGEKEITIQTSDGLHKTFKVTQVNIGLLLDDLRFLKTQAEEKASQLIGTSDLVRQLADQIAELKRLIYDQKLLRDDAGEQMDRMQRRWDEDVHQLEDERHRTQKLHSMHVKLCATRHLEETLQKVLRRNKQMHFDWMQATIVGNYVKFGAVWKLRKMFLANNERKMKNALMRWFKVACDPVALIRVNLGIPELYEGQIRKRYFFNKWRILRFQKQAAELSMKVRLEKMWFCLDRYWKRRMKVNYLCWRDTLIRKNDAIRCIYSLASKQRYFLVTQAFMKWRNFKENQDFQVRMHSMAIGLAFSQLQT